MVSNEAIGELVQALQPEPTDQDTTYEAVVSRVDEEGVVWVRLAGSDKETPTASTSAEVKRDDLVNVEWRNNKLYIAGNYSNPSAGTSRVDAVERAANVARTAAQNAVADAQIAREAAESVEGIAIRAEGYATEAKASAETASEYAARALGNLSTVQSVAETLNWITAHGTMTLTTDTALDPTHVYFVVDQNGDYEVGGNHYSVVTEPNVADISTYYELSIDESLNNYVGTHLAVTSEGLWLIPDAGGNKVLISTGQGTTYTDAGTYIIGKMNGNDVVLAKFTSTGSIVGYEEGARFEVTPNNLTAYNEENVKFFDIDYDGGEITETVYYPVEGNLGAGRVTAYWLDYPNADCDSVYPGLRGTVKLGANPLYEGGLYKNIFTNSEYLYLGYNFRTGLAVSASGIAADYDIVEQTNCEAIIVNNDYLKVCPTLPELIIGTTQSFTIDSFVTVRARFTIPSSGETVTVYRRNMIRTEYNSDNNGALTQSIWKPSATGSRAANMQYISSINGRVEKDVRTKAPSFIYGSDSAEPKGGWSVSLGYKLNASYKNQTAIGKYNDNKEENAFEIGNGTSDTERSNAFAVAWDGNVHIDLADYQTASTTDKAIYDALVALGWESEVTE